MSEVSKSPFFKPSSTPQVNVQTPGGTRRTEPIQEHKSTRLGCTANLINAIVGSGIVGIPYAIMNAGFVAGIVLVIFCAILTDKSLRLLIATAKHAQVPSYETVAEAAFGRWGFAFISINMFVMAYGAMLSYLMIVKDTFAVAFGVDQDDLALKRAILLVISLLIIVPLSSQRDMADLAKTSRLSVLIDCLLVLVVVFRSPTSFERISSLAHDAEWRETNFWIHTETIFVGLGVLSFAFVCQHSAFIIAGSLERPTLSRWSQVTKASLIVCASLALLCGVSGYVGFLDTTRGNIINNLQTTDVLSNVARGMLGTTMLFVYPMESFVARHVCVVLLFEGRRAHEGEDANILARRDRRIGLTVTLYISAVVPALLFVDLGQVLAATGAVGGSCLSYIGPGAIYMGIHGEEFLALLKKNSWWGRFVGKSSSGSVKTQTDRPTETTSLINAEMGNTTKAASDENNPEDVSICIRALQSTSWYLCAMPLWCWVAKFGETSMSHHRTAQAIQSPHPLRIGDVTPYTPQATPQSTPNASIRHSVGANDEDFQNTLREARAGSLSERGTVLPPQAVKSIQAFQKPSSGASKKSLNEQIGAKLLESQRRQKASVEKDPQKEPPTAIDFLIAVFFILFGLVAMFAGLFSLVAEEKGRR